MNFNMRWMAKKDLNAVLRIQESLFNSPKLDKKFLSSIVSSRKNPSFGFEGFSSFISYVCELDKKVVGYVIYKVSLLDFKKGLNSVRMKNYKNSFPMAGEIVGFCVDEAHRRSGVGSFIINSVISRFSSVVELSLKESRPRPYILHTTCSEKDLELHLFFKHIGFKGKHVSWNAFGLNHDGYVMVYESMPVECRTMQVCLEASK